MRGLALEDSLPYENHKKIREDIREPKIFQGTSHTWEAALAPEHKNDLSADGNFYRTLWHEVGHYLGVDRTKDGRDLEALHENSLRFDPATSKLTLITTSAMKLLENCWRKSWLFSTQETKRLLIGSLNGILTGTRTCMAA